MNKGTKLIALLLACGFLALSAGFMEQWKSGDELHWLSGLPKGHDLVPHYVAGQLWGIEGSAAVYAPGRVGSEIVRLFPGNRFSGWNQDLTYIYPPCLPFIASQFSDFPYARFYSGWTVFSVFCYFAAAFLLLRDLPREGRRLAGVLFLFFPGFILVLVCGQNSAFSLLVLVSAAFCLNRGREFLSGLLICLLAYKPQFLLAVIFFMLFTGRPRLVLSALTGTALTTGLCILIFGFDLHVAWVRAIMESTAATQPHPLCITWPGFLCGLFPVSALVMSLLAVAIALGAQKFLRLRLPCSAGWREGHEIYGAAMLSLLTLPYALHYDLLLGLPFLLVLVVPGLLAGRTLPMLAYLVFWLCSLLAVKAYDWHVAFVAPVITMALLILLWDAEKNSRREVVARNA